MDSVPANARIAWQFPSRLGAAGRLLPLEILVDRPDNRLDYLSPVLPAAHQPFLLAVGKITDLEQDGRHHRGLQDGEAGDSAGVEIGRESCGESVCPYVLIWLAAVSSKTKKEAHT